MLWVDGGDNIEPLMEQIIETHFSDRDEMGFLECQEATSFCSDQLVDMIPFVNTAIPMSSHIQGGHFN